MRNALKKIAVIFRYIHIIPLLFFLSWDKKNKRLQMDIKRWSKILNIKGSYLYRFSYLMSKYKEFRNLYIYRAGTNFIQRGVCKVFYPPMNTLFIESADIGGGMYIHHGFATIIAAKKIGENFWVNQQVTIGHKDTGCPVIGDHVTVTCGAKILGGITVGDHVTVGANAVVVKDTQSDCVLGGVPARVIKNYKGGEKI